MTVINNNTIPVFKSLHNILDKLLIKRTGYRENRHRFNVKGRCTPHIT